jgi:hypothetical protein
MDDREWTLEISLRGNSWAQIQAHCAQIASQVARADSLKHAPQGAAGGGSGGGWSVQLVSPREDRLRALRAQLKEIESDDRREPGDQS